MRANLLVSMIRAVLLLAIHFSPAIALAKNYTARNNYQFEYPDHWTAINRSNVKDLPVELTEWASLTNWNTIDVVVADFDGALQNVTVNFLLVPAPQAMTSEVARQLQEVDKSQIRGAGFELKSSNSEIRTINNKPAIVLDAEFFTPSGQLLQHRRYVLSSLSHTLGIRATASADRFQLLEEDLETMVASVRIEDNLWRSFGVFPEVGRLLGFADDACSVIAVVFALACWANRKK